MKPVYFFKFSRFSLRFLALWLLLLAVVSHASAQTKGEKIISGVVKGSDGETLAGVTVKIKSAPNVAVSTDKAGKYTIKTTVDNPVLVFSFIGYVNIELSANDRRVINATLSEDTHGLNEVVVIGYGTSRKKDLTGSVSAANMADLDKAPVKSIDDALAGRLAGVRVSSFDGQPGSSTSIVIRGANSITGSNTPLYVVDGFPIENFDLNSISPNDIASLDVLKDASSTAIYGARGSNGVIIITTKRGKVGNPEVNYNAYYGTQKDLRRVAVLSPYEFVKLQLEISPTLYGAEYTTGAGKTLDDYKNVAPIDWYGMVFRTGINQNHNLSIRGGTDKTQYSISGSILSQDGIIINTGYKRFQGAITIDQKLSDKLKVGLMVRVSSSKQFGNPASANGGYSAFMPNLWGYRPVQVDPNIDITTQLQDPDIGGAPPRVNPFLQAQNAFDQTIGTPVFATGSVDYALFKDLRLHVAGGVNNVSNEHDQFFNSLTYAGASIVGSIKGVNGAVSNSKVSTLSNEDQLNYSKSFNGHTVSATIGYSLQTTRQTTNGSSATFLPNESLGISGLDEGTPGTVIATSSNYALQSYLARVNYNYKSKYYLTGTFRADGSSKFPPKNKWGYFPSGAFAYRVSAEPFMKALPFISDAKFRASYGAIGNNGIPPYSYFSTLNFTSAYYSFGNATPSQGAISSTLTNLDLKWETTKEADLGLDLELLKGRISLTTDYYHKVTSDLLLNASLPITTGYSQAIKNVGSVSNTGLEFTLNTINIAKSKFQWSSSFNISFNKNKVLALTQNQESITTTGVNGVSIPYYIAKVGQPIALFYGLIYDGVYQYSDFDKSTNGTYVLKSSVPSNNTAATRGNIKPGDIKFVDLNHDGITNANDYAIIGNPNPDFTGGFTNTFNYKGFDLNIFFQFVYGNQIMDNNILVFENGSNANTNQFATFANRWTPTNTDTNIPRAGGATTNYNYSRDIVDGSYLSFKTASLGYTLPKSALDKVGVRSLRVYVSAQNIYMFTNYPGSSPDVSVRDSPLTPGFDFSSYPPARVLVAGLSLTF
ncbi:TonB-linked SusC/RagA family outer membrane protein [Mucilaginibacter gracilis]|uniref:TonB-linked SusC/RagA family outer membrane protein n=2 Tax=Mucilaginibacter gracilis TaxID=423350 RepID=A0A495IT56_9SPHI|nr:TonB-linked SusC/RagA family outer membrane protein [Mucilaginibacter gracilis]